PLGGGAPRAILDDARLADWSADGSNLAVVRSVPGKTRFEFPVGRTLYETSGDVPFLRVSRSGVVAFVEQDPDHRFTINRVGPEGRVVLSKGWAFVGGLAWRPDGSEIWFAGRRAAGKDALYAVTPSGKERLVRHEAGSLFLHDIFSDGRVLVSDYEFSRGIAVLAPGDALERDLSWRDLPWIDAIAADGRAVVFEEREEGGARTGPIYVRKVDGSAPMHLGEGAALGISPDGRWVLSQSAEAGGQERFLLLPTGPGLARAVEHRGLASSPFGAFSPDGARIVFVAKKSAAAPTLYAQDLSTGDPRTISSEGVLDDPVVLSPDGRTAAAVGTDGRILLCHADDGTARPLAGGLVGELPIVWSPDGRSLYVYRRNELPARIFRVDVDAGRRELWKEIAPADRTGLDRIDAIRMTPDGRAYAYGYTRILGSLQIAENLR
ncbi:MAG TPA: hypothetical protein VKG23_19295, partial [Thermoanaerobaculia bacterium]|nr:hypothetical protein [Thermoanaerobaculia bacterium]